MDLNEIDAFLYYGYVPNKEFLKHLNWLNFNENKIFQLKNEWKAKSLDEIVEYGSIILKKIIERNKDEISHVVPLSGGLDSRTILALLLEHYDNNEIKTITFGLPGTWDYEIGLKIANHYGISFSTIDLRSITWETERLVKLAIGFGKPIIITNSFLFSRIYEHFDNNSIFWIGFLGETLTGKHLPSVRNMTWEQACHYFIRNQRILRNRFLHRSSFNPTDYLPDSPLFNPEVVTTYDQLDLAVRQSQYIKPHVVPAGENIRTPFLNEDWINYTLSLSNELKIKQYAFRKILLTSFPELFNLPTKNTLGLPLGVSSSKLFIKKGSKKIKDLLYKRRILKDYVNPSINYVDFEKEFRQGTLKKITYENLVDLKKRNLVKWIDIETIWKQHQNKSQDLSKELSLLLSLEIHLKAGNFK